MRIFDDMKPLQHIAYIIIILILIGATYSLYSRQAGMVDYSSADSLLRSKDVIIDKYGREKVILIQQKQELSQALNANSAKLRSLLSKSTIAAVAVKLATKDSIITRVDTLIVSATDSSLQEIHASWKDQWSEGEIIARRDSVVHSITTYNQYSLQIENERRWFKPDQAKITIINENPHTRSLSEQAFVLKPNKKRRFAWFVGGVVVGLGGFILLTK